MEVNFWHERWKTNDIGFHQTEANALLVKYFKALSVTVNDRVFLPLCGKTLDIAWLLSEGYRVVGAELSQVAIDQLFVELGVDPEITEVGELKLYSAPNLNIFVGNIFSLTSYMLGAVDAIYDRAALVALPEDMRNQYTDHLIGMTNKAPQLLLSYEYDQSLMAGPPFSISIEEVNRHYGTKYNLELVESVDVPGGVKGKCAAVEHVWLLQNR